MPYSEELSDTGASWIVFDGQLSRRTGELGAERLENLLTVCFCLSSASAQGKQQLQSPTTCEGQDLDTVRSATAFPTLAVHGACEFFTQAWQGAPGRMLHIRTKRRRLLSVPLANSLNFAVRWPRSGSGGRSATK